MKADDLILRMGVTTHWLGADLENRELPYFSLVDDASLLEFADRLHVLAGRFRGEVVRRLLAEHPDWPELEPLRRSAP